ncbi:MULTISPECIES: hypothetical protein [Gimesia]|jgi:small nuclear ribonucleoprotein (snRNP)-like protein|uniref:Uncharacterized protein n=2 Tax=Gimesia TaxID=1649453 RepID=A0A6I6A8Y2_9PLAN|nr:MULTISPECIES: hypothetical protein [Gimesia]MBN68046.1 hypothetical protein [Gimesia sp.]QDT84790.1 hypothetical protein MalM14_24540 [Gimesia chilikensis]QDU02934.1 hypothetical protein V6x_26420 [Gimesia chilikensis]QGQ21491.1 hypothetical protein F1728_01760 [Gimesia benthica]
MSEDSQFFDQMVGKTVVIDLTSLYVIAGTLIGQDQHYLFLEQADVHDLRDTTTTRELYVHEMGKHGVAVNRERVLVSRREVVSVSALDDIVR